MIDNKNINKNFEEVKKIPISKLLITVIMLIIVVLGGTFAWFTYQSRKTALVLNIGELNNSRVVIKPYQINDTMVPVNIYTSGVNSQISVFNENNFDVTVKFYYKINQLDSTLINNGLKYTIVSSSTLDGNYIEVKTGDFTSLGDEDKIDIFDAEVLANTNVYYKVYLWLDSNSGDQSSIQNLSIDIELNATIIVPEIPVNFDLNGGSYNQLYTYTTPGEHVYTVPYNGEYKLEVWGAQGGTGMVNGTSSNIGGYGGYSKGLINLNKDEIIYVYVGGKGENAVDQGAGGLGGYNGGAQGGTDGNVASTGNEPGGGSGGATDIRYFGNTIPSSDDLVWNSVLGLNSRIIVAGGGGGGAYDAPGGNGGGFKGNIGNSSSTVQSTQETGNALGQGAAGMTYNGGTGAGGGGYYGGGAGPTDGDSGGGGSGYIGSSLLTDKVMYCYNCSTSNDVNTLTYSTTNVSESPIANYAKSGDGAAKITLLNSRKIVLAGAKYGNLPTPTAPTGYKFVGWNTNADGTGTYITSSSTLNNFVEHTLYAIFTINNYSITYNANEGVGSMVETSCTYGSSCTLSNNTFTRANYNFTGWNTKADGTGESYPNSYVFNNFNLTNNITLYAQWELARSVPVFTYTGNYQIVDYSDNVITDVSTYVGDWKIKFLTGGTFTSQQDVVVDVFLVGGGGGGSNGSTWQGGSGGGGGYTNTQTFTIQKGNPYEITIGKGGAGGYWNSTEGTVSAKTGGETSAFGFKASGGKGGSGMTGGKGGSGGGGAGYGSSSYGTGGKGGSNGSAGKVSGHEDSVAGSGQGTTTREFGETTGKLYSGGGGGGRGYHGTNGTFGTHGAGGSGGGAAGGSAASNNTGGGGGGGSGNGGSGKAGGSGIVVIRETISSVSVSTITLSDEKFYSGGVLDTVGTAFVGNSSGNLNYNWVVRYKFTTPSAGVRTISSSFDIAGLSSGTLINNFYWYVTTSSTSHLNAYNSTFENFGPLTIPSGTTGTVVKFTSSKQTVNLPGNTEYYLYVWNAQDVAYGLAKWYYSGGNANPTITVNN